MKTHNIFNLLFAAVATIFFAIAAIALPSCGPVPPEVQKATAMTACDLACDQGVKLAADKCPLVCARVPAEGRATCKRVCKLKVEMGDTACKPLCELAIETAFTKISER